MLISNRFTKEAFPIPSSLILFIILFLAPLSLKAKTIRVCESCSFQSIKSAITAADNGDTIEVGKGTYKESPIHITKAITLRGIDYPIVDGESKEHVLNINSDHVSIEGFKIVNGGVSDTREFAAIHADHVNDCQIRSNILENNAYGIYLAEVKDCILENNSSVGNAINEVSGGNGIHLWYSNHISILKNNMSHHRDGMYIEFSTHNLFEDNICTESIRYGLHFMFSDDNRFFRNQFLNNSTGVAIMFSKRIEVKNNVFRNIMDSFTYGMLLKEIKDSDFFENVFQANTIGITADTAIGNKFRSNQFIKNGWALNIFGSCERNQITENSFKGNVFDLSTNSRENQNEYEKNYWDKYEGFDLNGDGIGDKPYLPVRFFSYWVTVYPFLMLLFQSPVIEFLEIAERAFPVMSPVNLRDNVPQMKQFKL